MGFFAMAIIKWLQSNFSQLEQKLISRRECGVYKCQVADSKMGVVDRIFLIEDNRKRSEIRLGRVRFDAMGMCLDFLIKANAKFRFDSARLVLEFTGMYFEGLRIMVFGKKDFLASGTMAELGVESNGACLHFAPSVKKCLILIFSRHKNNINIHRFNFLRADRSPISKGCVFNKPLSKRIVSEGLSMRALLILPIVYSIETLLELYWASANGGPAKLYCLGTMNLFNRVLAMSFLANGGEVILKNHGIVRDCVAEYAIFTQASPYENGSPPISEPVLHRGGSRL